MFGLNIETDRGLFGASGLDQNRHKKLDVFSVKVGKTRINY
jgi:hypothetical protein